MDPHCLFWNTNSFNAGRHAQLELYVNDHKPLIVGLCETKHTPDDSGSLPPSLALAGYSALSKPGPSPASGGLVLYLRSSLISRRLPLLESSIHTLVAEVRLPPLNEPIIICLVYRRDTDQNPGWNDIVQTMSPITLSPQPCLFLGDFNAKHVSWGGRAASTNQYGDNLFDLCINSNLHVLNSSLARGVFTHISPPSVLDLAITSHPHLFSTLTPVDIGLLSSDHRAIRLSLSQFDNMHAQRPPSWVFPKVDWTMFRTLLDEQYPAQLDALLRQPAPLADADPQPFIDSAVSRLSDIVLLAAKLSIPQTSLEPSKKPWWHFNRLELTTAHRAHARAKRVYQRRKDERARETLHTTQLEFTSAVSLAKQLYSDSIANSLIDPATGAVRWGLYTRRKRGSSSHLSAVSSPSGMLPVDKHESLNNLAQHFANTCTLPPDLDDSPEHDADILSQINSPEVTNTTCPTTDSSFTVKEVKAACAAVRLSNSSGPDLISPHFLRHLPDSGIELLTAVLNLSWSLGTVPTIWRRASVIPLPKSGCDPTLLDSYRPISLTSHICKLFERLILKRLRRLVSDRDILYPLQAGFRAQYSCSDLLYQLHAAVRHAFDGSRPLAACFLDMSKAFDRVWHPGLLFKLHRSGIRGHAWRWIRSFLSSRSIAVSDSTSSSDWFPTSAGVPQGSVLSPFLFLIFINDLAECARDDPRVGAPRGVLGKVNVFLAMFADDVVLWPLAADLGVGVRALNRTLARAHIWARTWKASFNVKKSVGMLFSNAHLPPPPPSLFLG
ncbi:MAG: endonuclease/exonuclease/phosphatase family protein, partial [Proteiniphilum sp.]|nr:endonuclease/exonuclease/phosphatase family protein [Proteiniphilum sp.]